MIKEPYISKMSYEKICSQGKRTDMERLIKSALFQFGKERKKIGIIKVVDEFAKCYNDEVKTEDFEDDKEEKNKLKKDKLSIFGREGQADYFYESTPFFYDKNKVWFIWDSNEKYYVKTDEINLLNEIRDLIQGGIIESKARIEIINALKQLGRRKIPNELPNVWVQYRNKLYNIEEDKEMEADPKYLCVNPIPWKIGDSEDTPIIDNLVNSWVSKENVKKLYELMAFVTIPKMFIHSFFFLYGEPGMGKGTFINLLIKFIGKRNTTATSIERINNNSRFETIDWYNKLMINMSEVSNINELRNSGLINQATGGDFIKAEVKGGNMFDFMNYGKFIYPTNKLLKVDSDDGFGRRVRVINFQTHFQKEKDVLDLIPDEEFENLARKSLRIGRELWKKRLFSGDVSIQERMKKYQEISKTKLEKFIEEFFEVSDSEARIKFDKFYLKYVNYLNKKNISQPPSKIKFGKEMRNLGFEIKKDNWREEQHSLDSQWVLRLTIFGLKEKEEVIYNPL